MMKIHDTTVRKWISDENQFIVKDIIIKDKFPRPIQTEGGAICLCTSGTAKISIDTRTYDIGKGSESLLLPDSSLFIKECSKDFMMTVFLYSKDIHRQATHKLPPAFFTHIYNNPVYCHPEGCEKGTLSYLGILDGLQNEPGNRFGMMIAANLLRCMMLYIYDKIERHISSRDVTGHSRKEEIYNRFIILINERGRKHRDVAWYADQLCITSRYLTDITKEIAGNTPKQTIDSHIIREIKLHLTFSDMSIQQIADHMHFPDQSYLGRYFKHHTGISPQTYRKREMAI